MHTLPDMFARFRHDDSFKGLFKSFVSLAFVPVVDVYEYFCLLAFQFERTNEVESSKSFIVNCKTIQHLVFLTYFVKTWLGCRRIIESPPIPIENNEFGPFGEIDIFIRQWITVNNFANTGAIIRPEFWNVCDRWRIVQFCNNFAI